MMAKSKGKTSAEKSWHICDDCLDPLRIWMLSPEVRKRDFKNRDDFCLTGEEFHDLQFTCDTSLANLWLQINVSVEFADRLADRLRRLEEELRDPPSDIGSLAEELDNTGVFVFEASAVLRARIEDRMIKETELPKNEYSQPYSPSDLQRHYFPNVAVDTVTRWLKRGKIRNIKLSTKSYRIHAADLPKRAT